MQKLNGNPIKDATNNYERAILGVVDEEAKRLDFGRITIEATITHGKITLVKLLTTARTIDLNKMY